MTKAEQQLEDYRHDSYSGEPKLTPEEFFLKQRRATWARHAQDYADTGRQIPQDLAKDARENGWTCIVSRDHEVDQGALDVLEWEEL